MEKKCLCGYEYEDEYDQKGRNIIKGDEEFISIDGHFTITKTEKWEADRTLKVGIYACPKCNTIQMSNNSW